MSKIILLISFVAIYVLSRFNTTPSILSASILMVLTFVLGVSLHKVLIEEFSKILD